MSKRKALASLAILCLFSASASAQDAILGHARYREVAASLGRLIEHERDAQGLPAVSIALVADGEVVWSQGFGIADPDQGVPATAETVYRVGSVSKLFTDLALMQLVERGEVDLDSPVKTYLPAFDVKNATSTPITLRQLMSHRSGLTREPPVGHYFDPTGPTLADTVASLNTTEVVYPPASKTKYSNAAIAVVGQVVATLRKEPFEDSIRRTVLGPMGLSRSDFLLSPELSKSLAKAQMWTYDGRTFVAPTFPLGTSPAGNLYSTVNDLAKFLVVLMNEGDEPLGRVLKPETLKAMRKTQFAADTTSNGFGLGFAISRFEGQSRIGHGGAVYGFATEVAMLPDARLGVAVVASKDCANGTVNKIADDALRMMLAVRANQPLPAPPTSDPVPPELARSLRGDWDAADSGLRIDIRGGKLWGFPLKSTDSTLVGLRMVDQAGGKSLVGDSPLYSNPHHLLPLAEGALKGHRRVTPRSDPIVPESFSGLIGEYGWDHNVLYVFERAGSLWVLIEWFYFDALKPTDNPDKFRFADAGLYAGERADFTRDAAGRATQVTIGDVIFKRRAIPGEDGKTFRITPLRPVDELRAEALKARPPIEAQVFRKPEPIDLGALDPSIKLDIRYATDNNFLSTPFYSSARAFLQRPAAEALLAAHKSLAEDGFGLLIHDAYRPWYVTKMFWDATPEANRGFVADPSKGSKHNRGCAVDLTLYDLKTGEPIRMVGGYDEFSDRSNPDYPGGTSLQRRHRDRLRRAMEDHGFSVNELEWWHFDFQDWAKYPIGNARFEDLGGRP